MLTDFAKLETFLTVVKEKSFSKASLKLGISQPAVTQQMKFIEEYLDVQILDRKKNGIRLTKEGQMLHSIATKIERCVSNAQNDLLKIINKDISFVFGASTVIGNYLVPRFLNHLKENIHNDVSVDVKPTQTTVQNLLDKRVDMALVESLIPNDEIIYREWREDEIVIFSNSKLPARVKPKDLLNYKWLCRPYGSEVRELFKETLEKENYPNCEGFDITSEVTSSTTIVQTILCAPRDEHPTVSIISRDAIENDLKNKNLFESRIGNSKMIRKLYIAYRKDRKNEVLINTVLDYLLKLK